METEQKETVLSLDSPLQAVLLSLDKGIFSPHGASSWLACSSKGNLEFGPRTRMLFSPITSQVGLLVDPTCYLGMH